MTRPPGRTVKLADLVGPQEAADELGIDQETFRKWRRRYPDLPAPVKVTGGTGLWLRTELVRWRANGGGPKRGLSPVPEPPQGPQTAKPKRQLRAAP